MNRKSSRGGARWLNSSLALSLIIVAAGCGAKGTVTGKVTYQGKTLRMGTVNYVNEKTGKTYTGTIGDDGTYTVKQVPAGPAKISVVSRPVSMGGEKGGNRGTGAPRGATFKPPKDAPQDTKPKDMGALDPTEQNKKHIPIPEKYEHVDTSELTYEVKSGSQDHPIELK